MTEYALNTIIFANLFQRHHQQFECYSISANFVRFTGSVSFITLKAVNNLKIGLPVSACEPAFMQVGLSKINLIGEIYS